MRAAIFNKPRSITVGDRPDATVLEPTDAVVRVALACVCGSDLWYYRGDSEFEPGPIGHEFVGVVEDVGAEVHDIAKGDLVIAPFAFSDGTCPHCRHGITSACANGGFFPVDGDGGPGEAVRRPLWGGTRAGAAPRRAPRGRAAHPPLPRADQLSLLAVGRDGPRSSRGRVRSRQGGRHG